MERIEDHQKCRIPEQERNPHKPAMDHKLTEESHILKELKSFAGSDLAGRSEKSNLTLHGPALVHNDIVLDGDHGAEWYQHELSILPVLHAIEP